MHLKMFLSFELLHVKLVHVAKKKKKMAHIKAAAINEACTTY